jgi:hypothetical protein
MRIVYYVNLRGPDPLVDDALLQHEKPDRLAIDPAFRVGRSRTASQQLNVI